MSIICEEVFDEISHPAVDEIKDYALKIGIDPDSEPHLLPLATEALMKALPAGWKPCETTKKTQWEHPLDDKYRNLVKKVRAESQSLSLNEPNNTAEDATYAKEDELKSYEEIVPNNDLINKLKPLTLGPIKRDNNIRLSPLKVSPKHELKLTKQQSEDIHIIGNNRFIKKFNSFDEDNNSKDPNVFDRHPRAMENIKMELKVTGGGTMFLKSNTSRKISDNSAQKSEIIDIPKSILRDRAIVMEHSKSMDFDKISSLLTNDRSDKDDDERKSVRFNLDNNNITDDLGITFSEDNNNKSSSEEEDLNIISDNNKVTMDINKPPNNLKLIKVPPSSFIKPKLTVNTGSDSEEDTKSMDKLDLKALEVMLLQGEIISDSSPEDYAVITGDIKKKLEEKCEKKLADIKQKLWEEKNEELMNFKVKLEESHQNEFDRIKQEEKLKFEEDCKTELDIYKKELENRSKEERLIYDKKLLDLSQELQEKLNQEKVTILKHFDQKKDELERYYDEKLVDIEQELADKVERQKENLIITRNAEVEQLKKEIQIEEQTLKQEHENELIELRNKHKLRVESLKLKTDENKPLEKIHSEKRLLEDKYRCLKDKYSRLKTEVKLSLEKRHHHKKEQSNTNTTGSETEQSHSNNNNNNNNKEKTTPLNSPSKKLLVEKPPPTPAGNPSSSTKLTKMVQIQDLDTSISDNCYQSDGFVNHNNDSSDSINAGKSKKKLFSRLKSSSASQRVTAVSSKTTRKTQRSCSPVENLRKQLQKLEDLEDQFPENSQSDTLYHLRYPFSDGQKFEGQSSELEFFRHRIHLERDSIKRAKESLRSQKTLFKQRQNESKLKHGSMARHTLQQLCQEEKELTDMEVNLHRTRSLLGEKVIRLRHLEESLHRANAQNEAPNKFDDATLSDLSSHSASSGISSTEFLAAVDVVHPAYAAITNNKTDFQEPTEIIQSLENLNSEIREIWDVLRTQQQQQQQHSSVSNNTHHQVSPSLVYPDFGWPILAGTANLPSAPSSILTLADRLHNYRQHVAIANAQSTVVNAAHGATTTTLIERTRNLRHWLRQNGTDTANEANSSSQQANL